MITGVIWVLILAGLACLTFFSALGTWVTLGFNGAHAAAKPAILTASTCLAFLILLYHPAGFASSAAWAAAHLLPPNPLEVFK